MTASTTRRLGPRRTATTPFLLAAALVAVSVGASVLTGAVSVAVMALVALAAVLMWLLDTGPRLATSTLLVLLAAAWASIAELYTAVTWLDVPAHAATTGVLAAVITQALRHHGLLDVARSRWVWIGCATAVGLALAGVWEIAEWIGHTFVDQEIAVGYGDTIGDIAAGMVGAAIAGWLLSRSPSGAS